MVKGRICIHYNYRWATALGFIVVAFVFATFVLMLTALRLTALLFRGLTFGTHFIYIILSI
jgi:hypothetical protein